MLIEKMRKDFKNGSVFALNTEDNFPIEVTDTFLPYYTKDAINRKQNFLDNDDIGSRKERWLCGVSTQSGCNCRCKFCATGSLKKFRNLTKDEILEQVQFVLDKNPEYKINDAKEFKINYTRCGEPFLNIENVKSVIEDLQILYPNIHHYISTIGIKGSNYSWIKGNITLQISVHALNDEKRNYLIPYKNKLNLKELGQIRTKSNLKTTINLTLVNESDFDINVLKEYFDPEFFFVKLSPINQNIISNKNNLGGGIIKGINLI